jgi:hypothetical protein
MDVAHRLSSKANKTKTWVLMLGIAAVIGLDLAFTSLMNNEAVPDIAVDTVSRNESIPNQLPETGDVPEPAVSNSETAEVSPSTPHHTSSGTLRLQRSATRPTRPVEIALVRPRVFLSSRPVARRSSAQLPQPVERPAAYPFTSGPYVVTVTDNVSERVGSDVKDRKNSFISRLTPVVKKPWQWMRSIVSKLR